MKLRMLSTIPYTWSRIGGSRSIPLALVTSDQSANALWSPSLTLGSHRAKFPKKALCSVCRAKPTALPAQPA